MLFRRSKSMTAAEAAAAMRRGELQLVDVREPAELSQVRIEGATHIPLGQLKARLGKLDCGRPVVFLCASGNRSATATRAAGNVGLDARNIDGGFKAWAGAGLPVTTATQRGVA